MAAKKSAKKAAAVKKTVKAKKTASPTGELTLEMALDDKKIAAIQQCLQKGQLKITVKQVDLSNGKLGDSWLYD
ncbi:MAG: hypothetical protein KF712_05650 [Akkermansiaceae bacterium]|nr:hypothetical protein [Akkermansiaceae bacterium]